MPRKRTPTEKPEKPELLHGKYDPARFPMLVQYPEITPGQAWPEAQELPEGFRLDRNKRIWPVAVRKGREIAEVYRCIAMNKTDDGEERCHSYRMKGRTTCRMHGGSESAGIVHPNVTTGQFMRKGIFGDCNMPEELGLWYQQAIEDPAILDLTHNIAILAGRERELLGGLSTGEARASWNRAADTVDKLCDAARENDGAKMALYLNQLQEITRKGRSDTAVWQELRAVGENKRRMLETERKRRLDMKMVVSADQLRALLRVFSQIVFEEVNNIPAIAMTLMRNEGKLNTGRIAQVIKHRIGHRMNIICNGMQAGRVPDDVGV